MEERRRPSGSMWGHKEESTGSRGRDRGWHHGLRSLGGQRLDHDLPALWKVQSRLRCGCCQNCGRRQWWRNTWLPPYSHSPARVSMLGNQQGVSSKGSWQTSPRGPVARDRGPSRAGEGKDWVPGQTTQDQHTCPFSMATISGPHWLHQPLPLCSLQPQ